MGRRTKVALAVAGAVAVGAVAAGIARHVQDEPMRAFRIERAGVRAPPFELTAIDGSRVSLAELRGQVVFVNFWATWCPPCRDEMPSMVRLGRELERRYPGKFRMLALSVDEAWEPVKEYFAGPPFGGPPAGLTIARGDDPASMTKVVEAYYCDSRSGWAGWRRLFKNTCPPLMFPETYIVDQDGDLVSYVVGPRNWAHPAAREYLERLLAD